MSKRTDDSPTRGGINRREFLEYSSAVIMGTAIALPVPGRAGHGDPHYKPETGMKYRRLGRTNLMVSEIGLGCASISLSRTLGPFLFDKWCREKGDVANKLLDLGGNFVASNPTYHNTLELIGEALKHRRNEVYYVMAQEPGPEEKMRRGIEDSLRKLQTDVIDCIFSDAYGTEEGFENLRAFQREGMVRFVGMSQHNPRQHEWAIRNDYVDFILTPYNRLSQIKQGPRDAVGTERVMRLAKERDVGVVNIKPMTGNFIPYWANEKSDPEIQEIMKKLQDYGPKNLYQAMLRWNLANPDVTCCAVGMDSVQQVVDNVEAVVTRERYSANVGDEILEDYARAADTDYCRLCGVCVPSCPRDIPVPDILRFRMYHNNYRQEDYARELYAALPDRQKASRCDGCGRCEEACPYGLTITGKLREAHALLSEEQHAAV